MSSNLRFLAVDDEALVLEDLARMLESSAEVARVDRADSAAEALRRLSEARPGGYDAIFLDVRMPDLDGLELARILGRFTDPPAIVFVSAHRAAAAEAFGLEALDFLVKPVARRRLDQTLDKIAGHPAAGSVPEQREDEEIVAVDGLHGAKRLITRSSILYLRARGDYVRVVTRDGRFLLRGRLNEIATRWEPFGFVRVHRQYVVNLRLAEEMRPHLNGTATLAFPGERSVPVARRRIAELRRRLDF